MVNIGFYNYPWWAKPTLQLKNANNIDKQLVYTPMLLNLLRKHEKDNKSQPAIFISNNYDVQARKISEQQIVNAAYQIAELLKNIRI